MSDTIHRLIFVYSFLIFNAEQLLNDRQKLNASWFAKTLTKIMQQKKRRADIEYIWHKLSKEIKQ